MRNDFNENTLSSTDTDGDINLIPHGNGKVVLDNKTLAVDNLAIRGSTISARNADADGNIEIIPHGNGKLVTTTLSAKAVIVDNLKLDGNVLSSVNTDGNIEIIPHGNGKVVTTNITAVRLDVDNLRLEGNTLSATNSDGDVNLVASGDGSVVLGNKAQIDNLKLDGN